MANVVESADRPDEDLSAVGKLRKVVANEAKRILLAGSVPTVDDLLRGTGFSLTTYRGLFAPFDSTPSTAGVLRLVTEEARYQLMFDIVQLEKGASPLEDLITSLLAYHNAFNNQASIEGIMCSADGSGWDVPEQVRWRFRDLMFSSIDGFDDSFMDSREVCHIVSYMAVGLIQTGSPWDELNRLVSLHLSWLGIPTNVYRHSVESVVSREASDRWLKRNFPEFV